jgi:hypothetical protein
MRHERLNYSVRSMRLAEPTWEDLRLHKYLTKLTWNRLLKRMLVADKEVNKLKSKSV